MIRLLTSHRVLRFAIIGICNAIISFGLLNLCFYAFDLSKIASSIIATGSALIFSFVMNRGFVFGDTTRRAYQQFPTFVIVTISGSFIVLNLIYILSLNVLNGHEKFIIETIKSITNIELSSSFVDINLSTVIGAAVAMFWNYNGYKWFVFKGKSKDAIEEAVEFTP